MIADSADQEDIGLPSKSWMAFVADRILLIAPTELVEYLLSAICTHIVTRQYQERPPPVLLCSWKTFGLKATPAVTFLFIDTYTCG